MVINNIVAVVACATDWGIGNVPLHSFSVIYAAVVFIYLYFILLKERDTSMAMQEQTFIARHEIFC